MPWLALSDSFEYVYDKYKYFDFYSVGTDFRRQILTTKVGSSAVRVEKRLTFV